MAGHCPEVNDPFRHGVGAAVLVSFGWVATVAARHDRAWR